MALISTLTLAANGTVSMKCKNGRTGVEPSYMSVAYGTFGGGTLTAKVSADDGVTFVDLINNGDVVSGTAGFAEKFFINSDELSPAILGFTLSGATTPSITIKIYDSK
jgi:hypothetical protein